MTKRTLPDYVLNFKKAYEDLYASYLVDGNAALVSEGGTETPEFVRYAKAVRELIRIKMNKGRSNTNTLETDTDSQNKAINFSNNSSMVDSLRASGEYSYYKIVISESESKVMPMISDNGCDNIEEETNISECSEIDTPTLDSSSHSENKPDYTVIIVDDVLDHLSTEILSEDVSRQYYLKKGDSGYAFRSISVSVHNELVDMCKKLPKPIPIIPSKKNVVTKSSSYTGKNSEMEESIISVPTIDSEKKQKQYYKMVNLDAPIIDSEGNSISLGSVIADSSRDTQQEALKAMLLEYGITSFVHEMVADFIKNNKLFEMLEYLNNISEGQPIELYEEIYNDGFDHALRTIVKRLEKIDIDVRYLYNLHFIWKKNNKDIKKNSPNHWKDQAYTLVDAMVSKKKLF